MSRPARWLVAGYAGFGNAGDDLILETVARRLAALDPAPELFLQTGPRPPRRLHAIAGARILKRGGSLLNARTAALLPGLDGILYAGGSLLHGYTLRSLLSYAAPALLARLLGKRRILFGQGLGPFFSAAQERLAALALDGAEAVCVRDRASAATLARLGARVRSVETAPDAVFAVHRPGRVRPRPAAPGARKVGLNFRPAPPGLPRFDSAGILRRVVERSGDFAYLVALSAEDEAIHDAALAALPDRLRERVRRIDGRLPADELVSALAGLDVGCGERYHFHVLCTLAGVPTVALAYDPKVTALFADAGIAEFALRAEPGHAERAERLLRALGDTRRVASAATLERAGRLGAEAAAALDRLAERVGRPA